MGDALGNLEWGEQGGLDREGRDLDRDAAWTSGISTLGLSTMALLTLLFIFIGGGLGVGIGIPMLVLIVMIGAAKALVRGLNGSSGLWQALSLPAGEDFPNTLSPPASKERELLTALRDIGGMTPVEAAIETSLTVREADTMLSELAGAGHLALESRDGALFYFLPGRGGPDLENSN